VTAAAALPALAAGADGIDDTVLAEDEEELLSQEFVGLQLKHHLTRTSLEQQQQQQQGQQGQQGQEGQQLGRLQGQQQQQPEEGLRHRRS
jgi:hypothetical protein